jgi:hypothetical protein
MASSADWQTHHGAATGSPAGGTTTQTGRTELNFKNIDDGTSAYSSYPVDAGSNSFDIYAFVRWTGTFNQILNVLFAHTAGTPGTGITLKSKVAPNSNTYAAPSTSANGNLTIDSTSPISIGSGQSVQVGATSPQAAGKASSGTANPLYTQYLTIQAQTTGSASPGDMTTVTWTLQWDEN